MNTVVHLRAPQSEKPTVRGGRGKNADYRQREYLTEGEIDSLLATAGNSRNPVRAVQVDPNDGDPNGSFAAPVQQRSPPDKVRDEDDVICPGTEAEKHQSNRA